MVWLGALCWSPSTGSSLWCSSSWTITPSCRRRLRRTRAIARRRWHLHRSGVVVLAPFQLWKLQQQLASHHSRDPHLLRAIRGAMVLPLRTKEPQERLALPRLPHLMDLRHSGRRPSATVAEAGTERSWTLLCSDVAMATGTMGAFNKQCTESTSQSSPAARWTWSRPQTAAWEKGAAAGRRTVCSPGLWGATAAAASCHTSTASFWWTGTDAARFWSGHCKCTESPSFACTVRGSDQTQSGL